MNFINFGPPAESPLNTPKNSWIKLLQVSIKDNDHLDLVEPPFFMYFATFIMHIYINTFIKMGFRHLADCWLEHLSSTSSPTFS